jgi:erythromycin esterase
MSDASEDSSTEARAFIEWARGQAVPLSIPRHDDDFEDMSFLADVIAGKNIVTFGESAHYLHEWNRWRARLFKYLALNHGFSTFVLESGLVEGRAVHDYVAGADVEWDTVVASITNAWGVWAELNEMIRWMREWNADADRPRELRFYGMDGTGNWSHAKNVYAAVHEYASRVDQALADDVARDFEQAVQEVSFETREQVTEATWRHLIGSASLIVSRLEQTRVAYIAASSSNDFQWALRSAQILRDVFLDLAQTEMEFETGLRQFWNIRDVSMADSLDWVRRREGPGAKIVVGAHNTHLQQHPVRVQRATSMGSYFSSRFGRDEILFIGSASTSSVKGEPPWADCNQAAYEQIGPDCFFLDLRKAPSCGPVADWLSVERPDRSNIRYQPVCVGDAWDCLVFHRTLRTGEVELPDFLKSEPAPVTPDEMDLIAGRYLIHGFLAALNTLDVFRDGESLFTSGQDDTSGELFPPYRAAFEKCTDGRFRWQVWPAAVEFHDGADLGKITINMPGMGIYHGERVGDAQS